MSKYGAIPASSFSTPPAPPEDSTTTCATCPHRASALPFRPWRELADPRALSAPRGGLAGARHRARANLAYFAANYQLAFLAVVSVPLLWLWWRPVSVSSVLLCLLFVSRKHFPVIMALNLLELMMFSGAAASVLVSVPVGLLLVGVHAVLHGTDEDGADDEVAGSVVIWRRGMAHTGDAPVTAVDELV